MALSVALAVISMVVALHGWTWFSVSVRDAAGYDIALQPPTLLQPGGLLHSIIFGVLAGVAFFTGMACFFWSAVTEARQQRAEIISGLERLAGQHQASEGA
jgi:hypothetical protein